MEPLADHSRLLYKVHKTVMQAVEIQLFVQFYYILSTVTHNIEIIVWNKRKYGKEIKN